jgi:hypothetical protein
VKVEAWLFMSGMFFFAPIGIAYGLITDWQEPVGTTALFLTAGLALLIGFYLVITGRRIDPRPEDDPEAEIADGAGELGDFAPYSWWPLPLGFSAALAFLSLAVGWWILPIAVGLGAVSLVGWVYEFYRGEHAH